MTGRELLDATTWAIEHGELVLEYQCTVVAAVELVRCFEEVARGGCTGRGGRAVVLGLGAGSLAMYMAKYMRMEVVAVDMDPIVVQVAR